MPDEPGQSGFLPPEPPGPEPEIGARPAPPPPAQPPPQPQQPAWQQPQPGWQQQPPPGYWQPQPWQPPGPPEPDNGPAVAGFVLSLVGAGLLVISFGLLAFVSLILAIFGIVYARRGKRKVEAGETRKHRGLAQAGFVISIVTLVIGGVLTLLEIVFLIAYATDEEFREDVQDEFDDNPNNDNLFEDSESFVILLRLGLPIVRGVIRLVA
jgi:hypothetical protein